MSTRETERKNVDFLVCKAGSQTNCARRLSQGITQQTLSALLNPRTGRRLRPHEILLIEQELKIPSGWISRVSLNEAWPLVRKLQARDPESQELFNDMLKLIYRELE